MSKREPSIENVPDSHGTSHIVHAHPMDNNDNHKRLRRSSEDDHDDGTMQFQDMPIEPTNPESLASQQPHDHHHHRYMMFAGTKHTRIGDNYQATHLPLPSVPSSPTFMGGDGGGDATLVSSTER